MRLEVLDASTLGRRNATRIAEMIEQGATDDELRMMRVLKSVAPADLIAFKTG